MSVWNFRLPWIIVYGKDFARYSGHLLEFLQDCNHIWCHEFISSVLEWSTNPSSNKIAGIICWVSPYNPYFGIVLVVISGETDRIDTWQQPQKIIKPCTAVCTQDSNGFNMLEKHWRKNLIHMHLAFMSAKETHEKLQLSAFILVSIWYFSDNNNIFLLLVQMPDNLVMLT